MNRHTRRCHRRKLAHLIERGQRERERWLWVVDDASIDPSVRTLAELELDARARWGGALWTDRSRRLGSLALSALRKAVRRS